VSQQAYVVNLFHTFQNKYLPFMLQEDAQ